MTTTKPALRPTITRPVARYATIDHINRLAEERQAIWFKVGNGRGWRAPTWAEAERLSELTRELSRLWDMRRRQLAG